MTQDDSRTTSTDAPYRHRMSPEERAQPEWMQRCNPKMWSQSERDLLAKALRLFRAQGLISGGILADISAR